ncbi:MAG: MFS transporter [Thermoguttaceae bacterium]|nr:MFS transporter [Thermoguttaceae bacterium]
MNQSKSTAILSIRQRHCSRRLFCWNALLWGVGNGLVSSSLVIYIVRTFAEGAMNVASLGLAVSWIIAAPRLIGLLRILTPTLVDLTGNRKYFCFAGYLLSPLVLLLLPLLVPLFAVWKSQHVNLILWLVGMIWAGYHLIEYFASVALWTWLGDFLHKRIRVGFLARRQRWMLVGQMLGMLTAGFYAWFLLPLANNTAQRLAVYLPPAQWGIAFLMLSSIPIAFLPEIAWKKADSLKNRLRELLLPLHHRRFGIFVLFGCWIQLANGLTQGPQSVFQIRVLNISMLVGLLLLASTRLGQIVCSTWTGRLINRFGAVRGIAVSLLIVSLGPLCYMVATPAVWQPIIVAALLWIGWIGVNIGMENLSLAWAPEKERSSYIAFYFTAITGSFGLATLLGGWLFDRYKDMVVVVPGLQWSLDYYRLAFLSGWILRSLGILILLYIARNSTGADLRSNSVTSKMSDRSDKHEPE